MYVRIKQLNGFFFLIPNIKLKHTHIKKNLFKTNFNKYIYNNNKKILKAHLNDYL